MNELEERVAVFRDSLPKQDLYNLMDKEDLIVDYMYDQLMYDKYIYGNIALYDIFTEAIKKTTEQCNKHEYANYQRWIIVFDMMERCAKLWLFS